MSFTEIEANVTSLSARDKVRLIQLLSKELEADLKKAERFYLIGALHESPDVAAVLERALEEDRLKMLSRSE